MNNNTIKRQIKNYVLRQAPLYGSIKLLIVLDLMRDYLDNSKAYNLKTLKNIFPSFSNSDLIELFEYLVNIVPPVARGSYDKYISWINKGF